MILSYPVTVGCTCDSYGTMMFRIVSREKQCIVEYDLYEENLYEVLFDGECTEYVGNCINEITKKYAQSVYDSPGTFFLPLNPDKPYSAISVVTSDSFDNIIGYELYDTTSCDVIFVDRRKFDSDYATKTYNSEWVHVLPKIKLSNTANNTVLCDEYQYEECDRVYILNLELDPSKMDVSKSAILAYWSAHTPERTKGNLGPVASVIYGIEVGNVANAFYTDSTIVNVEFEDNGVLTIEAVRLHNNTVCIDTSNLGIDESVLLFGVGSCINTSTIPVVVINKVVEDWWESKQDRMFSCVKELLRRTRVRASRGNLENIVLKNGILGTRVLVVID